MDPLWYAASFSLGAGAALISDNVSLGFVHATEENVGHHLREHLDRLPVKDHASREILEKMLDDEINMAKRRSNRAAKNPRPIRELMWEGAKLMTKTAERF